MAQQNLNAGVGQPLRRSAWRTALMAQGSVSVADVRALRSEVFPLGLVERSDADELFMVERNLARKCPEWTALFIELVVDHLIWGERPTGTVKDHAAEWLIRQARITAGLAPLAIMVALLDEAQKLPTWFEAAVRGHSIAAVRGGLDKTSQEIRHAA